MGRGRHGALRDIVLGATAERVLRRCRLPVLVVRLPVEAAYSRPLLALDTDRAVDDLLAMALRVLPSPRPALQWVHAYEAPFEGFVYPSFTLDEARRYREHYRNKELREITARVGVAAREVGIVPDASLVGHVVHGPPREVIPEAALRARADLLVLGTHAYSPVVRAFVGTVAGDMLREVPSDALVVPPRAERSEVETG